MADKILCPVMGCKWEMDVTPPEVPAGALAEVFGWGEVERDTEAHLKTHSVLEWSTTVAEMRKLNLSLVQQLAEMGKAIDQLAQRSAAR